MTAREFGRYRLDRLLGRGAAGEVWLAYDPADARTVALKILSGSAAEDADYRRRFEREARIGAHLDNPHIAPIHRFGEYAGRLYLDMAYIPGVDLARLVRSSAMGVAEAVELISQIAEALDAAHAAGLVHRDVKPANVIVHTSGFAYLIDFGIARAAGQTTITATGFTVGTLAYMAPERFTGHGDSRSDVYSLACVLYECLTARRPFGDTDAVRQLHAHLHEAPPRPSAADARIPAALDAVVARGMAKRADDRYRTAGELAAAARAAVGLTISDRTPPLLQSEQGSTTRLGSTPATSHIRPAPAANGPAGPTFAATRQDAAPAPRGHSGPASAVYGYPGPAPVTRKVGSGPAGVAAHRPPAPVRATRILPDASAPVGPPAAPADHAVSGRPHPPSVRNPRPTLLGSTSFPMKSVPAQHGPATPPRRPTLAVAAALIGAAIVALAVVAGCTALLSSGSRTPSDQPSTTRTEMNAPAPTTAAPATPEPEYTTTVIPPRWTLPFPTNILPPPLQFPHPAAHSEEHHRKPADTGGPGAPRADRVSCAEHTAACEDATR
ncbi:serine/threonine-protein kinase [Nocardia mikamii]|uniref:serine/threonine-protein kinase n=1 Tax=Nocardia mikamii TaxID=508464 RepID=UPI0007A3B65B|nr:serine/threonine-protein kinase [Nocardia mikamii]